MACLRVPLIAWLGLLLLPSVWLHAADVADEVRFFEEKVRPILAAKCQRCHGESKQQGGLRLDSRQALLAGGDSGAAVEPGDPAASLLIDAINFASFEMPPEGKLADDEIAVLTAWVARGAAWPEAKGEVREKGYQISDEDRAWWAFRPLGDVVVPEVQDSSWAQGEIDRFVLTRLTEAGLRPSRRADRATLIRRLYFDLVGLPPTPEEVDAFLHDEAPDAYERLVDRLLDSERYGEKWARHWLDLVRFAESDGFRQDAFRPQAWRYRDYVVRSFNQDKPYDQFIREQLAGDELPEITLDALAATSYLRHWTYEYNQRDVRTQWNNILNDVTDVTAEVFLGLSVGCARCHDHKFDPIPRKDYYRLQAFFAPLLPRDDIPFLAGPERNRYETELEAWEQQASGIRREMAQLEESLRERAADVAINKFPPDIRPMIRKPPSERTPFEHQLAELAGRQIIEELAKLDAGAKLKGAELERWKALKQQLTELEKQRPATPPFAFTVTDVGPEGPHPAIPSDRSQQPIPPGFLSVLDPGEAKITPISSHSTGRRTALAEWIASPHNPLTPRVLVNRVWQYHFGQGIVPTSSDFGHMGDAPTHPELLDWLAKWYVDQGWRLKPLHRLIVRSSAYRQSSLVPPRADGDGITDATQGDPGLLGASLDPLMVDPENKLLWHMPVRRLDAEQIRDASLAVSGELDETRGGPSVEASKPRRTIYTKVIRNTRDPLLDVFDAPDNFNSTSSRNVTTTPTQALLMINGPWMLQRAQSLALRLHRECGQDPRERIERAFRLAIGRDPDSTELAAATEFLGREYDGAAAPVPASAAFAPFPGGGTALDIAGRGERSSLVAAPDSPSLPSGDFTVEAFVLLRSLYDDAAVRTIASQWDSDSHHPGWSLGVTSTQSRFEPRNLILQLVGGTKDGPLYEVVASNLRLELNRPYYVAVSVRIADTTTKGVTFYVRDLSQPAAAVQSARVSHKVIQGYRSPLPLVVGGRAGNERHRWDGLIDELRISTESLSVEQLRIAGEHTLESTAAHWQFEPGSGSLHDTTARSNHLTQLTDSSPVVPVASGLLDFCHVLLNSNEFLYLD